MAAQSILLYWPMTMAEIVNENDNASDSNDDDVKFVEEYAKQITDLCLVNIDYQVITVDH